MGERMNITEVVTHLEKWVVENKILEKAITQGKRYLIEYAHDEPEYFKKDFGIDAQEVDQIAYQFYRLSLSFFNPEFEIIPSDYIVVILELLLEEETIGYYKCMIDLEGNIFDDYIKDKFYQWVKEKN